MSIAILNTVWPAQCETPTAKLVLTRLADMANDKGICWPSVESLARDCGSDPRTIQRMTHSLVKSGHVTIHSTKGGRKDQTNRYELHPRRNATPGKVQPPAIRHPTPGNTPPVGVAIHPFRGGVMPPKPSGTSTKPSGNQDTHASQNGKKSIREMLDDEIARQHPANQK